MEGLPLPDFEVLHARDLAHAREMVGLIFTPYELELVQPGAQLNAWLRLCQLADSTVSIGGYGAEVRVKACHTGTFFAVVVPWSGTAEFRCGGTQLTLSPSEACVISPGDEDLSLHLFEDTVVLTYQIERSALEAYLAGMLSGRLAEPVRFVPAMQLRHGDLNIGAKLRELVDSIDRDKTPVNIPLVAQAFEQELMTRLLVDQPHNYTAALHAIIGPTRTRIVQQAVAIILSHPEWNHTVGSVASALSVSPRTLERGLRRERRTTLHRLLRNVRLQRAHDDLLRSSPAETSVSYVLGRWRLPVQRYTFDAYHERFGEMPDATLRRFT